MNDLHETIENVREKQFPELPKALVYNLIKIQSDFMNNPREAQKRIEAEIDTHLSDEKQETA